MRIGKRSALITLLSIGISMQAHGMSRTQELACGSILCLAGGTGYPACAPYLARYFSINHWRPDKLFRLRRNFLNQCPASDIPAGMRSMIARYGADCQPDRLVEILNLKIRQCRAEEDNTREDCMLHGNEWRRMCGLFYDQEYTIYQPPRLVKWCTRQREHDDDGKGYWRKVCFYYWTVADSQV